MGSRAPSLTMRMPPVCSTTKSRLRSPDGAVRYNGFIQAGYNELSLAPFPTGGLLSELELQALALSADPSESPEWGSSRRRRMSYSLNHTKSRMWVARWWGISIVMLGGCTPLGLWMYEDPVVGPVEHISYEQEAIHAGPVSGGGGARG